jgi:hypothetical protein
MPPFWLVMGLPNDPLPPAAPPLSMPAFDPLSLSLLPPVMSPQLPMQSTASTQIQARFPVMAKNHEQETFQIFTRL